MTFPVQPIPKWRQIYDQMYRESDINRFNCAEHRAEWEAMTRATKGLLRIQTEILGWPGVVINTPETLLAVLVADDREILRKTIRKVLDLNPELRIVGEAENFPQTVAQTRELHPRVVVMDLHMPAPEDFSHKNVKRTSVLSTL